MSCYYAGCVVCGVARFTEPPVLNMAQVVDDSTCSIPLIFVLSAGVVSFRAGNMPFQSWKYAIPDGEWGCTDKT